MKAKQVKTVFSPNGGKTNVNVDAFNSNYNVHFFRFAMDATHPNFAEETYPNDGRLSGTMEYNE